MIRFTEVKILYLPLLLCLFRGDCLPLESLGRLTRCLDGDTIEAILKGSKIRVRLAYIDAPEKDQLSLTGRPIGLKSKKFLQDFLSLKKLRIKLLSRDKFGRWIGEVFVGNISVNFKMIEEGMAVIYPMADFVESSKKYSFYSAYLEARIKRKGIWAVGGLMSPYFFRKNSRF